MAAEATPSNKEAFKLNSPSGWALCRRILEPLLPYTPHDYQLEGICSALDGSDVFAILPTGAGKTGLMTHLLLVARTLAENPSLCPNLPGLGRIPKHPILLAICPTNYIEYQLVCHFLHCG